MTCVVGPDPDATTPKKSSEGTKTQGYRQQLKTKYLVILTTLEEAKYLSWRFPVTEVKKAVYDQYGRKSSRRAPCVSEQVDDRQLAGADCL